MSEESVTSVQARPNLSRLIPAEIAEIFGSPPVLSFEDHQAYDQLLAQLVLEWKPRHITEWMFVRDIADISWEILRHRRAIASVLAISFKKALVSVIEETLPLHISYKIKPMANGWFERPKTQAKIKSELAKYGVGPDAIVAQCYSMNRENLDKLHRLLALAEGRRTAITRNFNEYRAMSSLSEKPVIDSKEIALVPDSA